MDNLDLGILKVLLVNNGVPPGTSVLRKSFRSIAKDLGVDQGTIRSRMKKFQERGVLKGWYLGSSPGLIGQNVVYAWFTAQPDSGKPEIIKSFLSVDDVERACDYLGPGLSLVLLTRKEIDPDVALKHLTAETGSNVVLHKQGVVQVPVHEMKETDAAIIGSLRRDPWKPYPTIARELSLSVKTVKRRIAKLSEDGLVYMLPIVDLKALHGIIAVELVVNYASPELRAGANERIRSNLRDEILFSNTSKTHGYFALIVSNVSRVGQISGWVKQQNGIKEAHADVLQDVILNPTHYEHWPCPSGDEDPRKVLESR